MEFTIENISNFLEKLTIEHHCSFNEAWDKYINPDIKKELTLAEVLEYIEDNEIFNIIKDRVNNDDCIRYSLEEVIKKLDIVIDENNLN